MKEHPGNHDGVSTVPRGNGGLRRQPEENRAHNREPRKVFNIRRRRRRESGGSATKTSLNTIFVEDGPTVPREVRDPDGVNRDTLTELV